MKMQLQELVYNRLNMIRSQVELVSTFGCMLQFHIFFFLHLTCVFSPVQAKSKTEHCQCAFKYHRARKRERKCYNYVCVQFSVRLCQWIHIFVHIYVLVCVCVRQGCTFVSLSVCAGRECGSVVCLCVEGPGCSPGFNWELQWSMSSAENSRSKPPTS